MRVFGVRIYAVEAKFWDGSGLPPALFAPAPEGGSCILHFFTTHLKNSAKIFKKRHKIDIN